VNGHVLYPGVEERLGIAGAGAIACGLATTAAQHGEVVLWARSSASADRARGTVEKGCAKASLDPDRVRIVTELDALAEATFIVEAVIEHHGHKAALLADIAQLAGPATGETVIGTTTSSLSISELAQATGRPEWFAGLHVFNPVPRMKLIELAFPSEANEDTRTRTRALCEVLGKTPIEVPDIPGFVVNRLLFPYLFSAVELLEETGMRPEDIDSCMTLGAGVPMGPLALLDFVGLDVSKAIGEAIGAQVPAGVNERVREGQLGRKTRQGFYSYE